MMEPPTPPKYGTRSSKRKAASQEPEIQSQPKKSKTLNGDAHASDASQPAPNSTITSKAKTPEISNAEKITHSEDDLVIENPTKKPHSKGNVLSKIPEDDEEDIVEVIDNLEARVRGLSQTPESSVTVSTRGRGGLRGRGRGATGSGRGSLSGRGVSRGRGRGGRGRGGRAEPVEANAKQSTKTGRVTKQPSDGPPRAVRFRRGKEKEGDAGRTALSFRKALLQQSYTKIANAQRIALNALAEKSEAMLKDDPKYHQSLPEAKEVIALLHEKHEKVSNLLDARHQMEKEFQEKKLKYDAEYQQMLCQTRIEDAKDFAELEAMKGFSEIAKGIKFGNNWDLTDADMMRLAPHLRIFPNVEPVDHLRKYREELAAEAAAKKEKSKLPVKKGRGRAAKVQTETEIQVEAPIARRKASLYQPESDPVVANTANAHTPALTPAESNPEEVSDEDLSEVENAAVKHLVQENRGKELTYDAYGATLFNKKGRAGHDQPNNRFAVKSWIEYEDHEIGNSGQIWKVAPRTKGKNMESFKDKSLTTHLHFDRTVSGCDASRNKPGDLDEGWVLLTKVHPITGLPIPNCENCDYNPVSNDIPPRTYIDPLRDTLPVEVISNEREYSDVPFYERPRTSLSRSTPFVAEEEKLEGSEHLGKLRLARAMKALVERDALENRTISSDLLEAASAASVAESVAESVEEVSAPTPTPKSTPRRRRGYDPVRDITHPRDPSPPVAPRLRGGREDTSALSALADVASSVGPSMPPQVQFFPPTPPPAPVHPSHTAGYREILPAPPRVRRGFF